MIGQFWTYISLDLVIEPSFHPPISVDPLSPSLSSENLHIANQDSSRVHKLET
jgi:hypothetical protein